MKHLKTFEKFKSGDKVKIVKPMEDWHLFQQDDVVTIKNGEKSQFGYECVGPDGDVRHVKANRLKKIINK